MLRFVKERNNHKIPPRARCFFPSLPVHFYTQLTPEMYDTNQDGDVYYEVFLRFVEDLVDRWREMEVTHHLTVVFFCRVYFAGNKVHVRVRRRCEISNGIV